MFVNSQTWLLRHFQLPPILEMARADRFSVVNLQLLLGVVFAEQVDQLNPKAETVAAYCSL